MVFGVKLDHQGGLWGSFIVAEFQDSEFSKLQAG